MKKRVFLGMSGGVDSSVSAALLKQGGYDVTGVFIKVWQPDWIECSWKEERLEAMRTAAHLDIPFVTLDLEKEYKKGVIDYMIREYGAGRTPNPDVMCNREVKFGAFWEWAALQGADFIATGHYAQNKGGRLFISKDDDKDQTYFLWTLTRGDLEHIMFPVGGLTKPEVRDLARKFGLPNADKKDSQGLCFMGRIDVKDFLQHYMRAERGHLLNESGEAIGHHPGALLFTMGERHGFTVTKKTPNDMPYYVIGKDMASNTVTVSMRPSDGGKISPSPAVVNISSVNWVRRTPEPGEPLTARVRYRSLLYYTKVLANENDERTVRVEFQELPDAAAPGQSLVIYDGDECLGGGIISS